MAFYMFSKLNFPTGKNFHFCQNLQTLEEIAGDGRVTAHFPFSATKSDTNDKRIRLGMAEILMRYGADFYYQVNVLNNT